MIAADQPTNFPADVLVRISSRDDGTILDRTLGDVHHPDVVARRQAVCESAGADYADFVYQRVVYDDAATYSLIVEVDARSTTRVTREIVADALFTRSRGVGMFLPIADCAGTVLYDPVKQYLAVAHMGRHSSLTDLLPRLVRHFEMNGSQASDLIVWMAPHAKRDNYKMDYFDKADDPSWQPYAHKTPEGVYLDIAGHNQVALETAGVLSENIAISPIDTMADPKYFSHARGDTTGRFAVLAMMR